MLPISSRKRLWQVIFGVFFNLTCAGVIFGFAALKPVLFKEGIYIDLCPEEEKSRVKPCREQDLRLNYMFTLATTVTNASALPIGALLDTVGPKYTTLLGTLFFFLGNIIFPLDYVEGYPDPHFVGFVLLAIGGPLIFLPSFHLSNTFPLRAGLILSCVTGAFDASSLPYVLYEFVYDYLPGAVSLKHFFWGYAIFPVLLAIQQLTMGANFTYKRDDFEDENRHTRTPTTATEASTVVEDDTESPAVTIRGEIPGLDHESLRKVDEEEPRDRVVGVMFDKSASDQIMSTWFLVIVLFLCIYMSRINYYIQTVFAQLMFFLHDLDLTLMVTRAFTILLPLGGLAGVPFVGWLLDNRNTFEASLVVMLCGLTFGILGMIPHTAPQLISISIFVVMRPLMYTFVGDYCGKIFGFATFGTVYGLTNTLSGLFGLVLRPVDVWVKTTLKGNYIPIDIIGIVLGLAVSTLLSYRIWVGSRRVVLE